MNEQNFNELLESITEVGLMERGVIIPSREFVVEKKLQTNALKTFAICLSAEDNELIPMKIYHVVFHQQSKTCTVKDESNETLVCPMEWFLPVEFPEKIEKLLEETEMALA